MSNQEEWLEQAELITPTDEDILNTPITINVSIDCDVSDIFSLDQCKDVREEALYCYTDGDRREDAWEYIAEYLTNKISLDRQSMHDLIDSYFDGRNGSISLDIHLWN